MLVVHLMGCPWLEADERKGAMERFREALEATFGGEAGVAIAQDAWLRACANYPGGQVPTNAGPEDRAVDERWQKAWSDAMAAAFTPWPNLLRQVAANDFHIGFEA